jgi:hypothetical protein
MNTPPRGPPRGSPPTPQKVPATTSSSAGSASAINLRQQMAMAELVSGRTSRDISTPDHPGRIPRGPGGPSLAKGGTIPNLKPYASEGLIKKIVHGSSMARYF